MNSLWMSVQFFGVILAELIVLFLGISTLVGMVFEYISDERLRRWLSRRGWLGYFLGAALGAVTPFCSCSTIPMTVFVAVVFSTAVLAGFVFNLI